MPIISPQDLCRLGEPSPFPGLAGRARYFRTSCIFQRIAGCAAMRPGLLGIVRKKQFRSQLSPLDGGEEFFFIGFQGQ